MAEPQIGRIVHYHLDSSTVRPAIVVAVWTAGLDLQVFTSPSDGLHCPWGRMGVQEGTEAGQWSWPERDGESAPGSTGTSEAESVPVVRHKVDVLFLSRFADLLVQLEHVASDAAGYGERLHLTQIAREFREMKDLLVEIHRAEKFQVAPGQHVEACHYETVPHCHCTEPEDCDCTCRDCLHDTDPELLRLLEERGYVVDSQGVLWHREAWETRRARLG